MSKIKICGLKRPEDIVCVNKYLPEYVGFVFAQSKRQVTRELCSALMINLDRRIKRVGVFVNEEVDTAVGITGECNLDVVQLHGDESEEYIRSLKKALANIGKRGTEVWKAIRVKDGSSKEKMLEYNTDGVVLDSYADGCFGGTGSAFDWKLAFEAGKYKKVILAGGLSKENIHSALRIVQPFAVDVSSGVETQGVKDEVKIRDFICMARSYE